MATPSPHDLQMFARLSTDRRFIEWLKAREADYLAKLGECSRDNFEPTQARYKEVQSILQIIQAGAEHFSRSGQHPHLNPHSF